MLLLLLSAIVFVIVVGLIIVPVYAQGEYVAFPETVSVPSSDSIPHNFVLKAIAKQSGSIEKVSGFKLDPINVVNVLEGNNIISATYTDQSIVFEQAKAKSSAGSLFQLQKTTTTQQGQEQLEQQNNGFSIAGLAPGVYTLDIIGTKNNAKAAYEGILVIGQNPESQEVKQVVEKQITNVDRGTTIVDIVPIFQLPPTPAAQPTPNPQQQLQPQPLVPLQSPSQPPGLIAQPQPSGAGAGPQFNGSNIDQNGRPLQTQPQQQQQQLAAIPPSGGGGQAPANQLQPSSQTPPLQQVPQTLAGQQQQQQPQPSSSSNDQPANGNGPNPCLVDPNSPECKIVDVETPSGAAESCPTGTQGTPPNCLPVNPETQPAAGLASTNSNDPLFRQGAVQTGQGSGQSAEDTIREDTKSGSAKSNDNHHDGDGGDSKKGGGGKKHND